MASGPLICDDRANYRKIRINVSWTREDIRSAMTLTFVLMAPCVVMNGQENRGKHDQG